jgi:hypothetical protein
MANKEIVKHWEDYAEKHLLGKKITGLRYLNEEEQEGLGFYHTTLVIQFDDGTLIFPSRDDEGNDAGALFGQSPEGEDLTFPTI